MYNCVYSVYWFTSLVSWLTSVVLPLRAAGNLKKMSVHSPMAPFNIVSNLQNTTIVAAKVATKYMFWNSSLLMSEVHQGSLAFAHHVHVPPMPFLFFACLCSCLLNALFNYVLARSSEVPLLKRHNAPKQVTTQPPQRGAPNAGGAVEMTPVVSRTTGYGTMGSPVRISHQQQHHANAVSLIRRNFASRLGHNFLKETDSLLQGDALHFPSTPVPGFDGEAPMDFTGSFCALEPPAVPTAPSIYVASTQTQAQALVFQSAAPPSAVDVVVAEANRISRLAEVRIEAQYIVFDTNRAFLLISVLKCLTMLLIMNYHFNVRGGWNRFVIITGTSLMGGLMNPIIEIAVAAILPNDFEVGAAMLRKVRQQKEEEDEVRDSVHVVELVLRYCTYEFKDLTTVFIQGSVFILLGVLIVPPLFAFCVWTMVAYCWAFLIPSYILYRLRRDYYLQPKKTLPMAITDSERGTASTIAAPLKIPAVANAVNDASSPASPLVPATVTQAPLKGKHASSSAAPGPSPDEERNIRMRAAYELLKCVTLKTSIYFLISITIQASFVLAMGWIEGLSYVNSLSLEYSLQIAGSSTEYIAHAVGVEGKAFGSLIVLSLAMF